MEIDEVNNAIASSSHFVDSVNQLISNQASIDYGMKQLDVQLEAFSQTLKAGLIAHKLNIELCRSTLDNYNQQISKLIDYALSMDDNNPRKWDIFDRATILQDRINDIIFNILNNN